MGYVRVAGAGDIQPSKMKMVKIGEKEILIANVNESFFAIPNRCTHANGNLSQGVLEGNVVTCPKHGSQFDVTTGKTLRGPKIGFLKLNTRDQPSFKVKVEGGDVLVDIG